jgi:hypothetical protein
MTFHFVAEGIQSPLQRATAAASDKDVRLGDGMNAIQHVAS